MRGRRTATSADNNRDHRPLHRERADAALRKKSGCGPVETQQMTQYTVRNDYSH